MVGYALATVWPARLVILDEPTNDVDPLRRRLLWRHIRRIAEEGSSVLLVTHNVLEAARAVDRLAVLDRGRVLSKGTPGALKTSGSDRLRLDVALEPGAESPPIPDFTELGTKVGRRLLMRVAEADATTALEWARSLIQSGVVADFEMGPTTLEDAYLRLIGREDASEAEGEGISSEQALYLCTGGSVIALLMVGLVAAPQVIAQYKIAQ